MGWHVSTWHNEASAWLGKGTGWWIIATSLFFVLKWYNSPMDTDLTDQLADAWLRLQQAHIEIEGIDQTVRGYQDKLDELKEAVRSYYRLVERMEQEAKPK